MRYFGLPGPMKSFRENAKAYIRILEQLLNHEIQFISVGARRDQFLTKGAWL